ncbi:MAG: SRPBCC domain-containing protein [Bacteroidota bacterium]
MKYLFLITISLLMSTSTGNAQNAKAKTIKKTFSRETSVRIAIDAPSAIVWQLLTDAQDFPRWNSTIISLEGEIKKGQKIKIKSTLDEKRVFTLKVKEIIPQKQIIWGDSKGKRTYTLSQQQDGGILFSMHEKIGGLAFPLYAKFIPPFDANFEQFAQDLKREAEAQHQAAN